MNSFKYHGSTIYGEKRKVLESAEAWGEEIKIKRFEQYADGSFVEENFKPHNSFVSRGKLYNFLHGRNISIVNNKAPIESFFELNTSKEKCLSGKCGVYFEFEIIN